MYRSFDSKYAVKRSAGKYATMIATQRTLGQAYKTLVRHHREFYRGCSFVMAKPVVGIIATEAPGDVIKEDIEFWRFLDLGPRSKRRLPLLIVVHQWDHQFNTYLRFGENS